MAPWRDLLPAWRRLRRTPVFALCAVAMLALAIGATTAVFSIVNAALLRPLPHVDLDRWVRLYEQPRSEGLGPMSASIPNYRDWKQQSRAFAAMVLWMPMSLNLSGDEGDAERVPLMIATMDALHTLGVRPAAGRLLQASDDPAPPQGERPAMISYGLWQRRFGGAPDIAGRRILLNLNPFVVVGVAPRDFEFPPGTRADVWVPQSLQAIESDTARDARGMQVSGLLRPGVAWTEASAELDVVAARLATQYRENEGFGVRVVPVRDEIAGPFRAPLLALLGALGLVILLVSVNVANLQLVRLEARRRELAVRAAIGASRAELVGQVLIESALIAVTAGALGLVLAPFCVRLVLAFVPAQQVEWLSVPIDVRVLLVSAGLTSAVLAIAGLLPALRGTRVDVAQALALGGRSGTGAPSSRRLRRAFVVAQLALSFVLVVGAGLMVQSFVRLQRVDLGFAAQNRLTLSYMAPRSRYPDGARLAALADRLSEAAASTPGVVAAGAAQALPFGEGATWFQALTRTDPRSVANLAVLPHVHYNVVSPGYAEALGLPVRAGRTFTGHDTATSLPVVVINEAAARRFFPNEDPIGQHLWVGHAQALPETPRRTVVGVVGDARWEGVDTPAGPEAWVPVTQQVGGDLVYRTMQLVAHTTGDPLAAVSAVRERIRAVDEDLALASVRTLEDRVDEALWRQRLGAAALGALGLAALAIALLGVFGVTSQLASRRAHEMGVRVALGATPRAIARLVLAESGRLVLAGVALGALGALLCARSVSSLLFGIEASDTATFLATAGGLASAAMLASYAPARRASRADPLVTLRAE
jgi:putative ABC transport system permease protein